jgi:hypothetical protein
MIRPSPACPVHGFISAGGKIGGVVKFEFSGTVAVLEYSLLFALLTMSVLLMAAMPNDNRADRKQKISIGCWW